MSRIDEKDWPMAATYFSDYADGRFDDSSQLGFIYPLSDASVSDDGAALFIGRAGADSIQFAYRKHHSGIWAHHPMEDRWHRIAPDIATLERGWLDGTLKV